MSILLRVSTNNGWLLSWYNIEHTKWEPKRRLLALAIPPAHEPEHRWDLVSHIVH